MTDQALVRRPIIQTNKILNQLQSGQLLRVKGKPGNAIVICHRHHAELAGPGAAVGGPFDVDCRRVIPVGKISIVYPGSRDERRQAYALRKEWILLTQKAMESWVPLKCAQNVLTLLYKNFDPQIIDQLPDEVIAQLVGVFPKTISMVRQTFKSQQPSKLQDSQLAKVQ
jgi:hypothetical protein